MDCTHLRYPTVVTVATYRVTFRATTICRLSSRYAARAEKKELTEEKEKRQKHEGTPLFVIVR